MTREMKIEANINNGEISLFINDGYVDSYDGVDVADAQIMIADYATNNGCMNLSGVDIYIDGESWTVNDGRWIECDEDGFPADK